MSPTPNPNTLNSKQWRDWAQPIPENRQFLVFLNPISGQNGAWGLRDRKLLALHRLRMAGAKREYSAALYVCMYVSMYVCFFRVHACNHVRTRLHMYACMHACLYA